MKKIILLVSLFLLFSIHSCEERVDEPINIEFSMHRGVPVAQLELNGRRAYFLIDTGATSSVLAIGRAEVYDYMYIPSEENFMIGVGGIVKSGFIRNAVVENNDKALKIRFKAMSMEMVTNRLGIVGIIGSDYLNREGYVIDYKNNLIYTK